MIESSLAGFFAFGLGYGMLHAFDPDHMAAVTGMAAGKKQQLWKSALHWSLGHGGVLLLMAVLVYLLGVAIPHELSAWAEALVAYMLMGIGLLGFWKTYQLYIHGQSPSLTSQSGAPLVGMLHGTAGSAPLLTLIPMVQVSEPVVGVVYVALFSLGVSVAMTGLGGIISRSAVQFSQFKPFWQVCFHFLLAAFAFSFGCYLLFER